MKKALQTILAVLGVGAIVKGVSSLRNERPKPTEEKEFTRVDYLSGDYKDALEAREREIEQSRTKGKWYLAAGAALLAGGVTLLTEAVIEQSADSSPETVPSDGTTDNGQSRTVTNGEPVPGASQ